MCAAAAARQWYCTALLDEHIEYRPYQQAFRRSFKYRFGQDAPARASQGE